MVNTHKRQTDRLTALITVLTHLVQGQQNIGEVVKGKVYSLHNKQKDSESVFIFFDNSWLYSFTYFKIGSN